MDNEALIAEFSARTDAATTAMFASTSDRSFSDANVNRALVTVIFGTVRNSFERTHSEQEVKDLRRQLIAMYRAYLETCVG